MSSIAPKLDSIVRQRMSSIYLCTTCAMALKIVTMDPTKIKRIARKDFTAKL